MGASAELKRFATAREKAYKAKDALNGKRVTAVSKIKREAEYYSRSSKLVQLKIVAKVEQEIRCLLPSSESRYSKQAEQILALLDQSKSLFNHEQTGNSLPATAAQRSASNQSRTGGTQLRLI